MKVIRYGGDEFILCFRHPQKDYIKALVHNTHAYLLSLKLEQEQQSYPLRVSMGACVNNQKTINTKSYLSKQIAVYTKRKRMAVLAVFYTNYHNYSFLFTWLNRNFYFDLAMIFIPKKKRFYLE